MDSKKKLFMSVCALCLMAVSSLASIAAVLAWTGQSVASNISVLYTASQVAGTVSASYTVGASTTTMKAADGTTTTLTFDGTETSDLQKTLAPTSAITLNTTNSYVVFEYVFTNASSSYAYPIQLTYADTTPTDANMNVYVIATGSKVTDYAAATWGDKVTGTTLVANTTKVPASSTGFYVYVKVAVGNTLNDASYSGAYSWTLGTP